MKLLNDKDNLQMLNDARCISLSFRVAGGFNPCKLHFIEKKIQYAVLYIPVKYEEYQIVVQRNNREYIVLSDKVRNRSINNIRGGSPVL